MKTNMTTLCYIEQNNCYLMLHRIKKENDINKDKWIGVGGHFEKDESPEECLLREVKEETGLTLNTWKLRGIITFISDRADTEYMFLYTSDDFTGKIIDCDEGKLEWVDKSEVCRLPVWEGDKIFLKMLLDTEECFSLKLRYIGDTLVEVACDGKKFTK